MFAHDQANTLLQIAGWIAARGQSVIYAVCANGAPVLFRTSRRLILQERNLPFPGNSCTLQIQVHADLDLSSIATETSDYPKGGQT